MSSSKREKHGHTMLPMPAPQRTPARTVSRFRRANWGVLLLFVSACVYTTFTYGHSRASSLLFRPSDVGAESAALCPQASPLFPTKNAELWKGLSETFKGDAFLNRSINWLAGAVQVP